MTITYNKEQQALIDAPINQIVIGASSAGSGKSTTMVGRAERILSEYSTGKIVLISFTRNAAEDLRQKLAKSLPEDYMSRVITGTYHSVMGRFIRTKATEVGLDPNFSIVDEASTTMLYRKLVEENIQYHDLFKLWLLKEEDQQVGKSLGKKEYHKIAQFVGLMVNNANPEDLETGQFTGDFWKRMSQQNYHFAQLTKTLKSQVVDAVYDIFKQSIIHSRTVNVVTYDLILFISYLMAKNGLLDSFKNDIVHTIVDEFQDSNNLQDYWVRQLAGDNLTLIGDVDQSIYSFRGGRPQIMDDYTKKHLLYNLSNNYRTLQEILDVGNRVIDINEEGKTSRKPMVAARAQSDFFGLKWFESENDSKEADHVVKMINLLHDNQGIAYEDMAILVRSRMPLPILNQRLQTAHIPLNDTTKFADFMKSEVVVDTLNFLKIFTNPKDIYAFYAVIDRPKRGIGPAAIEKLEKAAKDNDQGLVEFILSDNTEQLTKSLRAKVDDFATVYRELLDKNKDMTLQDAIDYLLLRTGYIAWISGLKDSERYLRHIDMLKEMVDEYVDGFEEENGSEYTLFDIATAFAFDMASHVKNEKPEGLTISTIHGAKGLEWKVVFLVGIEDGVFPMSKSSDLEDERRLMYVATTRAKDCLIYYTTKNRVAVPRAVDDLEPSTLILETDLEKTEVL